MQFLLTRASAFRSDCSVPLFSKIFVSLMEKVMWSSITEKARTLWAVDGTVLSYFAKLDLHEF